MVSLARLFEELEVLGELGLLREGDAVDAGQLLLGLVALPVGPGHGEQLDRLDVSGVRNVGPAAEVGESALRVEGDRAVLEILEQVELVFVSFLLEVSDGLRLRHVAPDVLALLLGQLQHLLLDRRKILVAEDVVAEIDVVIEPALHGRSHPELHARVECLERLGHQVRTAVPQGALGPFAAPGEELQGHVTPEGTLGVADFPVHFSGQHIPGKAFADVTGDVHGRGAVFGLADGAVGEGNLDHGVWIRVQR